MTIKLYNTLIIILVLIIVLPVNIQAQVALKKPLTPADYSLWNTLSPERLSPNGSWVSYRVEYDDGSDSLFVQKYDSKIKYSLQGHGGLFSGNFSFLYGTGAVGMVLLDLNTGHKTRLPFADSGDFTGDSQKLITFEKHNNSSRLLLRTLNNVVLDSLVDIEEFKWNATKTELLYSSRTSGCSIVGILNINEPRKRTIIVDGQNITFENLTWSGDDTSIAFYGKALDAQNYKVYYYNRQNHQLFALDALHPDIPMGWIPSMDYQRTLRISDDGQKVFFKLRNVEKLTYDSSPLVEIWNANDALLYDEAARYPEYLFELAVWHPTANDVTQITKQDMNYAMLLGNQDYSLVGSSKAYEPRYQFDAEMDFYITELKTGHRKLVLKKHLTSGETIVAAPSGEYLFYYNNKNWWSYCIATNTHHCITKAIDVEWDNNERDSGQFSPYGYGGFTNDGQVLFYDYNDVWAFSIDGAYSRRITDGVRKNIRYRIEHKNPLYPPRNFSGYTLQVIDFTKGIWMSSQNLDTGREGYVTYTESQGITMMTNNSIHASYLLQSDNSSAFIYMDQSFDSPPNIVYSNGIDVPRILFQSNSHHFDYNWGKAEYMIMRNKHGSKFNAVLQYPANYDLTKKYPMVVYIYDAASSQGKIYVNPTLKNPVGFNNSNLTTSGYFVLFPDIIYERGKTGKSVVDCLEIAVNTACKMASIDPSKVGLFGHSFGGYEVNFAISHTNIFAAAVSGSGISDVVSSYLCVDPGLKNANSWRFEAQQYRMGGTLFKDKTIYLENSPVLHAAHIETPLLLFTGKADTNVKPEQSFEMYLALRRLKKKAILLSYPQENHILLNPRAQEDLSIRTQAWFNYFLKQDHTAKWITTGVILK